MTGLQVSVDVSAVPVRPAGAGRYTLALVGELGRRQDVALTLVSRTDDARRWAGVAPRARVLPLVPGPRPVRLVWEQVGMHRALDRQEPPVQVHHGPHYTMPERLRRPVVVTIHDLTFFDHPEWHERSKVPFFRRAIRVAAARADALVCVSEDTADRLRDLMSPRPPVHVVPHGVDRDRFRPDGPGADEEQDRARLRAAGVDGDYVAFLGTGEPRKGLDLLIRAFDRLAPTHPGVRLVVAGGVGWSRGPVEAAARAMAHPDRLVRTGYLDDDTVPALLRRARAVAYPSRVEGFGLPVLEALACGAQVITTAGTTMSAVAGGSAVLVPSGDVTGLAAALDAVLSLDPGTDPEARARRRAGLEVAAAHTWEASAAAHVEVYRRAVENGAGRGAAAHR